MIMSANDFIVSMEILKLRINQIKQSQVRKLYLEIFKKNILGIIVMIKYLQVTLMRICF